MIIKAARQNLLLRTFLVTASATVLFTSLWTARAGDYEPKPKDPYFIKFNPRRAPAPGPLILKQGDRLAIIGDSITEQKMYSRIMETYLTVCVPELKITTRQFGWSGETAEGFLQRMTNDCLRFHPTVATTCYGMNDFRYRPFDMENEKWYIDNYSAVVRSLKDAGAVVVLGSPGCVGKVPSWTKSDLYTMDELNINLCAFRDGDIALAKELQTPFADIFWTLFKAGYTGKTDYGQNYALCGRDGVHPGWAGHLVMAYAFLRAMGLDGDIGTFTVDLGAQTATATAGHTVDSFKDNQLTITSTKYPFCASGDTNSEGSLRSGATLVPFFQELSRFNLIVKNGSAMQYYVIWGSATNTYTAGQLADGVNLAADFVDNPFCEPFRRVDEAVAAKQEYETRQIKQVFHSKEAEADMEKAVATTEAERAPLAQAIADAMTPVTHTIVIQAVTSASLPVAPDLTPLRPRSTP
ncbi:MAG TPA: SGNH/GDSL hydrolase family protein [Candidatus Acidoferrales bacterium]|nr:SGNH/GDSL hydrolase family protein [Candidatus Acidoferrales bacterium]